MSYNCRDYLQWTDSRERFGQTLVVVTGCIMSMVSVVWYELRVYRPIVLPRDVSNTLEKQSAIALPNWFLTAFPFSISSSNFSLASTVISSSSLWTFSSAIFLPRGLPPPIALLGGNDNSWGAEFCCAKHTQRRMSSKFLLLLFIVFPLPL